MSREIIVEAFDYSALDTETRIVVRQRTSEIKSLLRRTAQDAIDIGCKLAEIKETLGHGNFGVWLNTEFAWSDRTARNYIAVFEVFKSETVSDLVAPKALYLLASANTPEEARRELLERANDGEKITHALAKTVIGAYKAPVAPLPDDEWDQLADSDDYTQDDASVEAPAVSIKSASVKTLNEMELPLPHGVGTCPECGRTHARWSEATYGWRCGFCFEEIPASEIEDLEVSHPNTWEHFYGGYAAATCPQCGDRHTGWQTTRPQKWLCGHCRKETHEDELELYTREDAERDARIAANNRNRANSVAVFTSSESNEWYTPSEYIEAARLLMGGIDLDPASCKAANEVVLAQKYFTIEDDGLAQEWRGRVWLNPPYGRGENNESNQAMWSAKLIHAYRNREISEAVLLVNAVTDREWFYALWAYPICFTDHRIEFWRPSHEKPRPTHGNAIVYLGSNVDGFIDAFSQFGVIVTQVTRRMVTP